MRIGLVTGEYPPDQGGVGDFTHELGQAMAQLGHQVHVITSKTPEGDPRTADTEVVLHRAVEAWRWGCWRAVLQTARVERLEALDLQYQAAAYDMHPAINFLPRPRNRLPVVATFHDLKVPYLFPKAGPLRWWVVRTLARRADGVIVTNREDLLQLEKEISPRRLAMIPIGSNITPTPPSEYDRATERSRWGVGADDLLLGYFGFLNESKGGEELMEALAILVAEGVPAHLLMIGGRVGSSDPTNRAYAERVDRLIAQLDLGKRVHWTGYVEPEEVSASLLATDVCILPYRDGVSFRRGTLQACLAHGRAVVTTRPAVELAQACDGENMLLVEPRGTRELADAVKRLTADPHLKAQLEAGAEALAATFAWDRIARETVDHLRELLNRQDSAAHRRQQ
jgi:glycosyltransferase involved in cell wall biosynthesis